MSGCLVSNAYLSLTLCFSLSTTAYTAVGNGISLLGLGLYKVLPDHSLFLIKNRISLPRMEKSLREIPWNTPQSGQLYAWALRDMVDPRDASRET
jgi:hypothetical protein